MPEANECENCGHDLKSEVAGKGHMEMTTKVGRFLRCNECLDFCRNPDAPAVAGTPVGAPPPTPVQRTEQDVESLAKQLAMQMMKIANQQMWQELHLPGALVEAVDGGFIVRDKHGRMAVRGDVDAALAKAREFLMPPS